MRCNRLWFMLDIYQNSLKTSRRNCFLERTNRECIINQFRRVIHTLSVNSTQFVESRAKLLNAYNEPELSHSSYSLFNYIALCNANETIPGARSSVRSFNTHYHAFALLLMNLNSGLDVFQNTDFFTYNRCRAILTYDKQLHYLLTDAKFF